MVEACNKRIIQSKSKRSSSMFEFKSMHLNQHVSQVLMRKNMNECMKEADSRGSASADGKFDRTRRTGNRRRGRMLSRKALDAHVNVEAELKT